MGKPEPPTDKPEPPTDKPEPPVTIEPLTEIPEPPVTLEPKANEPGCPPTMGLALQDYFYPQMHSFIKNWEQCARVCRERAVCKFWTYYSFSDWCVTMSGYRRTAHRA